MFAQIFSPNLAKNLIWLSFSPRDRSILDPYRADFAPAMLPGWEGNAPPLRQAVVDLAERLLSRHATTEHLVEVSPGNDGSLSFVWNDEVGNYIYLDVGPGDTVHLYYDLANGSKWEGVSVAGDERILERIAGAFRATRWPLHQVMGVFVRSDAANSRSVRVETA